MSSVILKTVGWGNAISNIDPMGNLLHITVNDWHSFYDGPITPSVDVVESQSVSDTGQHSIDKIQTTQSIHATWMPSGSNRITAPNIRVGERVEVLQQSDAPIYFWRPAGLDDHLRKLETIIVGISGTPSDGDDSMDPDSRYWMEISSHGKHITFRTSAKNGEQVRFSGTLNPGEGEAHLMDDRGNALTLNSMEDHWTLETSRGCKLELNSEDLKATVPANAQFDIVQNFKIDLGGNLDVTVGGSTTAEVSGQVSIKSPTGIMLDGGGSTFSITSAGIVWTAPSFTGN